MIGHGFPDPARLQNAERRLALVSDATHGFGVEAIWLDEADRSRPSALPDALYVNRDDPYTPTLLYDVRRDAFLATAWGDWLEAQEAVLVGAAEGGAA